MNSRHRRPLDNRTLSEQYQFTQGDTIIAREQQKQLERQKKTTLKHGCISAAFIFLVIIFAYSIS